MVIPSECPMHNKEDVLKAATEQTSPLAKVLIKSLLNNTQTEIEISMQESQIEYPSECPMNAQNGSLLVNTPDDVDPLNMVMQYLN